MTTDQKPPDSSLRTRLKSAAVFAPAALLIIFFGGASFTLMMAAMAAAGAYEWVRMVTTGQQSVPPGIAYLAAAVTGIGVLASGMVGNPVIALWFLLALCFLVFAYNFAQKGPSARLLIAGIVYIGFSAGVMIWIRGGASLNGLYHFLTLLFIVWASDIAAYFSGRAIGGPKLAPAISPKKTWAGFIGSSIGAGFAAAGMACPWVVAKLDAQTVGNLGTTGYFVMGFILAMFGQGGDLLISAFKRHFGVKDTGALIPGHGGILDRVDALLLVALLFGSLTKVLGGA